jgi:hypothetical protein
MLMILMIPAIGMNDKHLPCIYDDEDDDDEDEGN